MSEKIFISYNHKDQILVDMIARRLEFEFGRNNIFYDAWSMQPGDSIIGKMNEGLSEFTTFFLFVSPDSLDSSMVSLEWQTALNRAVNNDLKFVAVRLADCNIPTILSDKLYIDLYGDGLDSAIERMKRITKNENCYIPLEDAPNVMVDINVVERTKAIITVKATMYAEHNPCFAFACENVYDEFDIKNVSEAVTLQGRDQLSGDGIVANAYTIQLHRVLKPGFPFVVELHSKDLKDLRNVSINILKDAERRLYQRLPVKEICQI